MGVGPSRQDWDPGVDIVVEEESPTTAPAPARTTTVMARADADLDAQYAHFAAIKRALVYAWDAIPMKDYLSGPAGVAPFVRALPSGSELVTVNMVKVPQMNEATHRMGATAAMDDVMARNAAYGVTPPYNPVIFRLNPMDWGELDLELFRIKRPEYRQYGLGRALINAVEQGMADAMLGPDRLRAVTTFFPTFYTVDSHYGWEAMPYVVDDVRAIAAGKKPPNRIYPPFLEVANSEQTRANRMASGADMAWCPPQVWTRARVQYLVHGHRTDREALRQISDQLALVRRQSRELRYGLPEPPLSEASRVLDRMLVLESIRDTMSDALGSALVDDLVAALVELGNDDGHGEAAVDRTDALLMRFRLPASATGSEALARLVLAYAIDYGRVMYRPLVMTAATAAQLMAMCRAPTLTDIFLQQPDVMPAFAPYFAELGGSRWWLWVPVRKPHSTSNYQGTDVVPLPAEEPEPVFVTLAKEKLGRAKRPAAAGGAGDDADEASGRNKKRVRLEQTTTALSHCAHCRRPGPTLANVMSAFCDRACYHAYMH